MVIKASAMSRYKKKSCPKAGFRIKMVVFT